MRTPSTPATALAASPSTISTLIVVPAKKRSKRRASSGTTSSALSVSSSAGLGIARRARQPVDDLGEVRAPDPGWWSCRSAVRLGRPAVDLDRVVVEVLRADGGQHARRGGERLAGLAQEALDGVVADDARLERAEALERPRRPRAARGTRGAAARARRDGEEGALDALVPGDGAQHADRTLRFEDLAPRPRAGARGSGRRRPPCRQVPTPTRMPAGTEYVIQALPPTTAPCPITVLPPRMVALA